MMRALAQSTLLAAICADAASAQLVAPPFSAPGQPLSTLQSELVYSVDLGALPLRQLLIVEATPDAAHPELALEVEISGCTLFSTGGLCPPNVIAGISQKKQDRGKTITPIWCCCLYCKYCSESKSEEVVISMRVLSLISLLVLLGSCAAASERVRDLCTVGKWTVG